MRIFRNKLLETFCVVVESGGFTEAQYRLGITQSAVSCRIRDLEVLLGYRLCERGRSGFALTERGDQAYRKAREILSKISDFDAELHELRGLIIGELRLGLVDTVSTMAELPLVEAIQRFHQREQSVELEVVIGSPAELEQALLAGTLHLAVAPFCQFLPELEYVEVVEEYHAVYAAPSHPLAQFGEEAIETRQLYEHPQCRRSYDPLALPAAQGRRDATVSNMEAAALLLRSGAYFGMLPCHYAADWVSRGDLVRLNAPDLERVSTFYLASRRTRAPRRATELFCEDLLAEVAELRP